MKITNRLNFPEPVVAALQKDTYSKGDSNRSITQLIDSPRIRILFHENKELLEKDVSSMVWTALGNAVHLLFENEASEHNVPEERLYIERSGWKISGAIDLQTVSDGGLTISDYKCTSAWSVLFGKSEWEKQLNGYAWLVRHAKGVSVNKLQIIAILRDWNWRETKKNPDYPEAPLTIIDVPLWADEEQDRYFDERIAIHQQAEILRLQGQTLPLCSSEEKWQRDTTYAVKKNKNKTAVRVLKSQQEAEDYIRDRNYGSEYWIEQRQGEAVRCSQDYCGVASFCDQYQNERREL